MKYTNKQLESMTDSELAADIVREKLAKLSNPYSPFASKLRRTYNTLCEQAEREKIMNKIVNAATDGIYGSLEQGPTGNYWIDNSHNLSCEKLDDEICRVELQATAWRGEHFAVVRVVDSKTTEKAKSPTECSRLREIIMDIVVRNAYDLCLSQAVDKA